MIVGVNTCRVPIRDVFPKTTRIREPRTSDSLIRPLALVVSHLVRVTRNSSKRVPNHRNSLIFLAVGRARLEVKAIELEA